MKKIFLGMAWEVMNVYYMNEVVPRWNADVLKTITVAHCCCARLKEILLWNTRREGVDTQRHNMQVYTQKVARCCWAKHELLFRTRLHSVHQNICSAAAVHATVDRTHRKRGIKRSLTIDEHHISS